MATMSLRLLLIILLLVSSKSAAVLAEATTQAAVADTDLSQLKKNLDAEVLADGPDVTPSFLQSAGENLKTLSAEGSWPDQDYSDRSRVGWKAGAHLARVESFARLYRLANSPLRAQPEVLAKSIKALAFWVAHDPKNQNWWINEIGVPSQLGRILILLDPHVPDDLKTKCLLIMARARWAHQAGANLTDETRIQVMRGSLTPSAEVVLQAFARSWQEVRVAAPQREGLQADGSFHQHGPLIYNSGYGSVFIDDITSLQRLARGTHFEMPPARRQILDDLLLGSSWMVYRGCWDFGVCGRSICRFNGTGSPSPRPWQEMAQYADPHHTDLLDAYIRLRDRKEQPPLQGDRAFWLSDYLAHRRENYFFSIRTFSGRTLNTDGYINDENRRSHHLADGATCVMSAGREYYNVFPLWDWRHVPGTTVEQNTPLDPEKVSRRGNNDETGEVSDGTFGCAAMHLQNDHLSACKAWFCFDRQIVCLGAGIDCDTPNAVDTTINQCSLRGDVVTTDGAVSAGDHDLRSPGWVWHDSIGYFFPVQGAVHLQVQHRTGRWSDIGSYSSASHAEPMQGSLFSLWRSHGPRPRNADYAYAVYPGITSAACAAVDVKSDFQIVSNSTDLQAVWNPELKLLQAVFRKKGECTIGGATVETDSPVLLMLQLNGKDSRLTLASLHGRAEQVRVKLTQGETAKLLAIDLPGAEGAGKSVSTRLP